MKKVISMLLILSFVLVMTAGCGQNKETVGTSENANANVENTVVNNENTANKEEPKNAKNPMKDDVNTELFGIPKETEDYDILDLSDPKNTDSLEDYGSKLFGMEGYVVIGEELKEGDYFLAGTGFFIWAKDGAFKVKEINYSDEMYYITLEKMEKGTPQSHEMLHIVPQKPFKDYSIKYTDGKDLLNITLLDKEVGLERVKGEFQKVENDKIYIIPAMGSKVKPYTMVDVPAESLEGLQKGDTIEYMRGYYADTVYAIRKIEE